MPKKEKRDKSKKYQEKLKSQSSRHERFDQDRACVIEVNMDISAYSYYTELILVANESSSEHRGCQHECPESSEVTFGNISDCF